MVEGKGRAKENHLLDSLKQTNPLPQTPAITTPEPVRGLLRGLGLSRRTLGPRLPRQEEAGPALQSWIYKLLTLNIGFDDQHSLKFYVLNRFYLTVDPSV